MLIKMIASDVDGTLLHKGQEQIPAEVFSAFEVALEKEWIVVVASGRDYASLKKIFHPFVDSLYFISTNGGQLVFRDEILFEAELPRENAEKIAKDFRFEESYQIVISTSWYSAILDGTPEFIQRITGMGNKVVPIADLEEIQEKILKVSVFCPEGALNASSKFADRYRHLAYPTVAGDAWLDFNASDKGHTLAVLAERLHVPQERIYAFGDQYNDLGMLEYAGHPYLHAGALEALQQKGFATTVSVSEEIRKIVGEV